MSAEIEDIKRVLAICFRMGDSQSADDLERILSFDMGWMDTETAHDAIKALTFAGWLKDENGILTANCDLRDIRAPLGWQPRPSRLTDPAVNEMYQTEQPLVPITPQPVIKPKETVEDSDPRSRVEKRLIRYIAKQDVHRFCWHIRRSCDRRHDVVLSRCGHHMSSRANHFHIVLIS